MNMNKPLSKYLQYSFFIAITALSACGDDDNENYLQRQSIDVSQFFSEENLKFDSVNNPQGLFTSDDTDTSSYSDVEARRQLVSIKNDGIPSTMSYLESGNPQGEPIILIHGTPSQAYLWRNVMPLLPQNARILAPDLIGYGYSSKHDIEYSFKQHAAYIHAFIVALGLVDEQGVAEKKITFVGHDIGNIPALAYAARFPNNIKGLVFFEAMLGPVPSFDVMPQAAQFFRTDEGHLSIIKDNAFMNNMMFTDVMSSHMFSAEEEAMYREPFLEENSRRSLAVVPREVPILGGAPDGFGDSNIELLGRNAQYLMTNSVPRLFMHASPGVLIPESSVAIIEQIFNPEGSLTSHMLSEGKHFLQEDIPIELGLTISQWYNNL